MLRIKNLFNDYKNNKFTIHLGESRNLLHESDLQKEANVLYLRKKNRFFPSEKLLNLKSRFSDNLRKVNAL